MASRLKTIVKIVDLTILTDLDICMCNVKLSTAIFIKQYSPFQNMKVFSFSGLASATSFVSMTEYLYESDNRAMGIPKAIKLCAYKSRNLIVSSKSTKERNYLLSNER